MKLGRQAPPALLAVTALMVSLVGPCICGPTTASTQPSHGCCDPEAGLTLAPLECCAGCSVAEGAQHTGLLPTPSPGPALAPDPRVDPAFPRRGTAPVLPRLRVFVVSSPPTVLRV